VDFGYGKHERAMGGNGVWVNEEERVKRKRTRRRGSEVELTCDARETLSEREKGKEEARPVEKEDRNRKKKECPV